MSKLDSWTILDFFTEYDIMVENMARLKKQKDARNTR